MTLTIYVLLVVLGLAFLYFGYRDDYRRDSKKFIQTVCGIFLMGSLFVLSQYLELDIQLPLWLSISLLVLLIGYNIIFGGEKNKDKTD